MLEKFGLANILSNGGGGSNGSVNSVSDRQVAASIFSDIHDDSLVAANAFNSYMFSNDRGADISTASMFSPFSPEPSYLLGNVKTEQPTAAQSQALPHPSKGFVPWFNSAQDEKAASGSGKVSPTAAQTIRPSSATQQFNYLGDRSTPMSFQATRAGSRQEGPIARPDPSRRTSQEHFSIPDDEPIQDLNRTLASLDLDHAQNAWKVSEEKAHKLSGSP